MQLEDMKLLCETGDVRKVIIGGCRGSWSIDLYVGDAGLHFLETVRSERWLFKTIDSAFEVALEFDSIILDHNEKACPIEIHHS